MANDITALGKRFNLKPDSVYIETSDIVTDVMYDNKVLVSFTDQDGLWESCTRDQLAAKNRLVIIEKLKVMKEEHGLMQLFKRIGYFVLVIVGQFLLFWGTNWLFRKLKLRIMRLEKTRLKPFSIQGYELLDTRKQVRLLIFLANLVRYAFMFLQLLLRVPLLFSIFPQTKNLAYRLLSYIWNPVKSILTGILDYLPNLFTIFVIYMAIKYLVRFFRYLAEEVQSERLKLSGFYPDWAMPISYCPFLALCVYDSHDLSVSAGFQFRCVPGNICICRFDCIAWFKYGDWQHHCRTGNYLHASFQDWRPY